MEKIELEKNWIWKEFTYWPNSRTSPAFFLPLPGLPCLARPTRRLPHADALARTPRGPACCPACLVFPPARAPHSSAHRPTAPLARFFITARSLSHCTSAPPVSVFSLLSFLLPRASFFFPGSFLLRPPSALLGWKATAVTRTWQVTNPARFPSYFRSPAGL